MLESFRSQFEFYEELLELGSLCATTKEHDIITDNYRLHNTILTLSSFHKN